MLSFAYAKAFPIADARTFHDWVRNQFGEKLFSDLLQDLHREGVGHVVRRDLRRLGGAAHQGPDLGVAVIERAQARAHAARGKPKAGGPVVKTLIESFQYPRKGPGMMWEAAARKIMKRGGKVLMGRELQKLSYDADQQALAHRGRDRATAAARPTPRATSSPRRRCASWSSKIIAAADLAAACARAALPRLPHRRADGEEARSLPRQLDLHPRSGGEGRPRAELPLLVARDGAGRA